MKRWTTIHVHMANPKASLIRSPGLSYTVEMDSLWGLLMRAVTVTSAPMNTERRTTASIRSPIGMVDADVPTSSGPGCHGLALMGSTLPR
jgi:hypothetical protein